MATTIAPGMDTLQNRSMQWTYIEQRYGRLQRGGHTELLAVRGLTSGLACLDNVTRTRRVLLYPGRSPGLVSEVGLSLGYNGPGFVPGEVQTLFRINHPQDDPERCGRTPLSPWFPVPVPVDPGNP